MRCRTKSPSLEWAENRPCESRERRAAGGRSRLRRWRISSWYCHSCQGLLQDVLHHLLCIEILLRQGASALTVLLIISRHGFEAPYGLWEIAKANQSSVSG